MSLLQYENWDKDAAYKVITDMRTKIQQEFPMDQKLVDAVNAVQAQQKAAELALAQKNGYASVDAMMIDLKYKDGQGKYIDMMEQLKVLDNDYLMKQADLTRAYNDEFQKRYEAACIEAINRIKANANTMK